MDSNVVSIVAQRELIKRIAQKRDLARVAKFLRLPREEALKSLAPVLFEELLLGEKTTQEIVLAKKLTYKETLQLKYEFEKLKTKPEFRERWVTLVKTAQHTKSITQLCELFLIPRKYAIPMVMERVLGDLVSGRKSEQQILLELGLKKSEITGMKTEFQKMRAQFRSKEVARPLESMWERVAQQEKKVKVKK
ncbi:MAG: hypothetical protein WCW13_04830 [archaeon]|jgi:hypothetical protein